MYQTIREFAPEGTETGVGLAILDESERFIFFLAGDRHNCPPGELFYAGIGGHKEEDEDHITCAHREAREEIGSDIDIISSEFTWYVPQAKPVVQVYLDDQPRPFALYEMIHPPGTPREGQLYRIIIYSAKLMDELGRLALDEVQGVIALSKNQVIQSLGRKPKLSDLLEEGARLLAGIQSVDLQVRLYPLGTAEALAHILRHINASAMK